MGKGIMKHLYSSFTLVVLLSCSIFLSDRSDAITPDLIFYNGTVITIEEDQPLAQALAVQNDTIVAVGSNEDILAMEGESTQLCNLNGRTLIPGIVDAHTHIFNDAEGMMGLTMQEAQQLALKNGITTLGDMYVTSDFIEQMRSFEQAGYLKIRTSLYMVYMDPCGGVIGDWYKNYPPTRNHGELLRIGGVKFFEDGGSCGRPALSVPYPNGNYGDLWLNQAELNDAISEAHNAGYQVAIHAIGDSAIKTAQDAIEFALNGEPNTLRHRIEHNSIIRPDLLKRYGNLDIVTVLFGYHEMGYEKTMGRGWCRILSFSGLSWIYPYRALLDTNPELHVAWHGDDPWIGPISPILELHYLVTRITITDEEIYYPPEWFAATAIEPEEALRMMTMGAAYALFREEEVGSLKPGKYADLVILSDNPLAVELDAIKDIQVLMTMIGGEVLFGSLPTGVAETDEIPGSFLLSQNHPNPFNPETTIRYHLPKTIQVKLSVFNASGQRISTLVNEIQPADNYAIQWDGRDEEGRNLASGIYLYRLETEDFVQTKKMLLLR